MVGQGCEIYFICESFRGLHFTLFSSFPVSIKPLQSAMLWCTLLHTDIQQYMYCSSCMILWYLSHSQKGRGVSSVPYTAHLVPCLEGGDVLLISSPLGLPFVAIFCSLDVQLLRILPPWWSWCSHMYVK